MDIPLFGHLVDVAPGTDWTVDVAIVNELQIEFAVFVTDIELCRVAQVAQEIAVARDVGLDALQVADERSLSLLVLRVERFDLRIQNVPEVQGGCPGLLLARGGSRVELAAPFSLGSRDERPSKLLGVREDARLDCLVLTWLGHVLAFGRPGRLL